MSTDILLTVLNAACGVVLGGIGIEMVNTPPNTPRKKLIYRFIFAVFGVGVFVITVTQAVRTERAQKTERDQAHFEQMASQAKLSYMQGTLDTISKFVAQYVAHPPAQSVKFDPAWALAVLKMVQVNPASQPRLGYGQGGYGAGPYGSNAPPGKLPVISSVPKIFQDGEITGKNFGTAPGVVYMHLRVKQDAQGGYYGPEGAPDNLLGNTRVVNRILVTDKIQKWSDTRIQLKFSKEYWDMLMLQVKDVASRRNIPPPAQSDIEAGYEVNGSEEEGSFQNYFYAH